VPRHVLPDVLGPGLKIVFCGSAVGTASAQARAYYAKPGNKFWPTLAALGLTPTLIVPSEYKRVIEFGIGMTDMCKSEFGSDDSLSGQGDDARAVRRKILRHKPRALAFNGKRAAAVFFGDRVEYGLHKDRLGETAIFVLPSTSGRAGSFWNISPWRDLATFVRDE
jgi:TDG/mug DNA glycosylase family protein